MHGMGQVCPCKMEVEEVVRAHDDEFAYVGNSCLCSSSAFQDLQCDLGKDGILGCSSIGTVVKTFNHRGKVACAVKRISKKCIEGSNWKEHLMRLKQLDHPHVCKLHDTLEDLMSVYLVMELCQGGNIMNVSANRDKFNETTVAVLVSQMVSAVAHLHQHEIFRTDIRPENWLFQEPVQPQSSACEMCLKMIDFGLASKLGCSRRRRASRASTESTLAAPSESTASDLAEASTSRPLDVRDFNRGLFCLAPEQLDNRFVGGKADIWALGVIAYFLLSGQSPFELVQDVSSLSFRNARVLFMPSEIWRPISMQAKSFVALCLQKDSERRPTALEMLELPWMQLGQSWGRGTADDEPNIVPMPTAAFVLSTLDRRMRAQLLQKVAIITAAQSLHRDQLSSLLHKFEGMDLKREGVLPVGSLQKGLSTWGVPCDELDELARDNDTDRKSVV